MAAKVWSCYRSLGISYKLLKRLWEPGLVEFCAPGGESVIRFTCFTLFIDWSELVVRLFFVCWGVCLWLLVFVSFCWPIFAIELSTDDYFSTAIWLPQLLWRAQHGSKNIKNLRCLFAKECAAYISAVCFFCCQLLKYVPGGSPFSQHGHFTRSWKAAKAFSGLE